MRFENNGHRMSIVGADIISTIDVNVSDSFVKDNKLESSRGSGEARLYVGTREKATPFLSDLFIQGNLIYKAIIHKADLQYYLETARIEYEEPENYYRRHDDMGERHERYLNQLNSIDELSYFWVKLHNGVDDLSQNRIYIDGVIDPSITDFPTTNRAKIYNYLRSVLLPLMSKIQITKIKDLESPLNEELLWFRPYIHETTRLNPPAIIREEENRILNDSELTSNKKFNLIAARIGQGKFRSDILERFQNICAISVSDQTEILEACHIKPWIQSTDNEKLDKNNGILLTRNLHKLFDLGFITFDSDINIIFSSFVTTQAKRECYPISNYMKNILRSSTSYLEYHRNIVFVEEV